ncbi:hypothetical protein [Solitalea canadensis]|uniref:Uncharacterized protein n=1 Tax=Solitalea canadensis (strain ATCC 29591 / DSM 3403 / JCM 21819 / LMG 8368 / NBRC 15130 / NCIMB 12057 / USAM 9D) TaxID=929556 RepID=H8KTA1_SOLCM|nr:hypothetical protein [Solitalea canadensis]AFD06238.1 hypothetical protein Solca_1133 [Solitalea canadensis DSM 3403]
MTEEIDPSYFFFDLPIYQPIIITNRYDFVDKLIKGFMDCFEGYDPNEKRDSTFEIYQSVLTLKSHMDLLDFGGHFTTIVACKRTGALFFFSIFWNPEKGELMKTGQYPSIADFHIHEVKQYSKVLSKERLKEFTKAIGLAANGVGIGSFVYLRRIFEYLINEAYGEAKAKDPSIEGPYQRGRMDDKINLLKDYLPDFLVTNKSLYSILSLGVHELSEEDCLKHFDSLRVGIELILDEKVDTLKKQEKIAEAQKKISTILGLVKK